MQIRVERGCGLPTPPRRALLGEVPAVLKVNAWAPGVAAAMGPGETAS